MAIKLYYLSVIGKSLTPVKLGEHRSLENAQAHADILAEELGRSVQVSHVGAGNKSFPVYVAYFSE